MSAPEPDDLLRVIAAAVPALVSYIDADYRYRWANRQYERWLQQRPDEIAGRHVREVLGEAAWRAVQPHMARALAGEDVVYEKELPYRAGGARWVRVTYTPDRTEAGTVRGFVVLVNEIAEQKRAEERIAALNDDLRARVEELEELLRLLPVGVFIARDPACREMTMNDAGAAMLGLPAASNPSKSGPEADALAFRVFRDGVEFAPEDLPMQRAAATDQRIDGGSLEILRGDGSRVELWLFATPLHDAQDRVRGAVGAAVDVTERNRQEAALRESESRHRALFQLAGVGAGQVDAISRRFVTVNRRLCEITGYSEAELREKTLHEITHPDDRERDRALFEAALRGEQPEWQSEKRYVRPDGSAVWVLVSGRMFDHASGRPQTLAHVIDVTERKRAQEALRVVEEQLRARVAELDREHQRKDQFLAMLAHELRNPLAPIQNAAALLGLGTLDAGALEQIRGILERQVSQLTRLVDDLLDVSRINRGKIALHRVPTPLASILDLAVETTRPLFDQRAHRLDVAVPPGPLWVDADPTRLAQAIANLLNNAARYTEPGGHVVVSVERESDGAAIRVRDDGIGIAPETLPQVFEMFVQGGDRPERSREGLGIGLTLVRRLVEMHGGSVEARSEGLGRGAEFVVRLPLVPAADERPAVAAASGGRSGLRVLVVDDNVDAAETLGALLRALDHQVRVVFDGRAALDAARLHAPHVTFLDLGMPGMSGYDVAKALRGQSETAGTWLVALTGWGETAARRRTQEAGFDEHLVKPPRLDRLRAVLARAAPSSRAVAGDAPAPAGPLTHR